MPPPNDGSRNPSQSINNNRNSNSNTSTESSSPWLRSQSTNALPQDHTTDVANADHNASGDAANLSRSTAAVAIATTVIALDNDDDEDVTVAGDAFASVTSSSAAATAAAPQHPLRLCNARRSRSEPVVMVHSARIASNAITSSSSSTAAPAPFTSSSYHRKVMPDDGYRTKSKMRSYLRRCRDALIGSSARVSDTSASRSGTTTTDVRNPFTHHEAIEQRASCTSWYLVVDETAAATAAPAIATTVNGETTTAAVSCENDAGMQSTEEANPIDLTAAAAAAAITASIVACQSRFDDACGADDAEEDRRCAVADGDAGDGAVYVAVDGDSAAVAHDDMQNDDEEQLSQSSADTVLDMEALFLQWDDRLIDSEQEPEEQQQQHSRLNGMEVSERFTNTTVLLKDRANRETR